MFVELATIGGDTATLLKQKVSQGIYDFLTGINTAKGSLPRQGNLTKVVAPLIATDDLPKDQVIEIAKATEIKLAMDVKSFLEACIRETPQDVNIGSIMKSIPITVINRGGGHSDSVTEQLQNRFNTHIGDKLLPKESLQYEIEHEAILYADVDVVCYSEAATGTGIVSDRAGLPTTVHCEIKYITGRGEVKTVQFAISVECTPRYVSSNDLRVRLASYNSRDFYRNFVRMEKGEINFITDWMLDLKMLKLKAKSAAKGNADIFHIIDNKRLLNDMGVNVYPFVTMLVSANFADELMAKESLDMYSHANQIMKKFFCMGIYIYDQDMDTVEFMYDGDKGFKKVLFDDLAKDSSKYERELKQLIRFNK